MAVEWAPFLLAITCGRGAASLETSAHRLLSIVWLPPVVSLLISSSGTFLDVSMLASFRVNGHIRYNGGFQIANCDISLSPICNFFSTHVTNLACPVAFTLYSMFKIQK